MDILWEKVKNDKGESLLQLFYQDMPRWSYTFQNYAYITWMRKLIDITKKTFIKSMLRQNYEKTFLTKIDTQMYLFIFCITFSKI